MLQAQQLYKTLSARLRTQKKWPELVTLLADGTSLTAKPAWAAG